MNTHTLNSFYKPLTLPEQIAWQRAMLCDKGLTPTARMLGASLLIWLNEKTGRLDPGQRQITERTGLSPQQIKDGFGMLTKHGWVQSEQQTGKGGKHGSSMRRLTYPPALMAILPESAGETTGEAIPVGSTDPTECTGEAAAVGSVDPTNDILIDRGMDKDTSLDNDEINKKELPILTGGAVGLRPPAAAHESEGTGEGLELDQSAGPDTLAMIDRLNSAEPVVPTDSPAFVFTADNIEGITAFLASVIQRGVLQQAQAGVTMNPLDHLLMQKPAAEWDDANMEALRAKLAEHTTLQVPTNALAELRAACIQAQAAAKAELEAEESGTKRKRKK